METKPDIMGRGQDAREVKVNESPSSEPVNMTKTIFQRYHQYQQERKKHVKTAMGKKPWKTGQLGTPVYNGGLTIEAEGRLANLAQLLQNVGVTLAERVNLPTPTCELSLLEIEEHVKRLAEEGDYAFGQRKVFEAKLSDARLTKNHQMANLAAASEVTWTENKSICDYHLSYYRDHLKKLGVYQNPRAERRLEAKESAISKAKAMKRETSTL